MVPLRGSNCNYTEQDEPDKVSDDPVLLCNRDPP